MQIHDAMQRQCLSLKQAAYCLPAGGGRQAGRRRRQAIRQARAARFELMTFLLRTTKDQISYKNGAVIISDELWWLCWVATTYTL